MMPSKCTKQYRAKMREGRVPISVVQGQVGKLSQIKSSRPANGCKENQGRI